MELYPLIFEPILKEKVWGGQSLEAFGKTLPDGVAIGESWELADLPDTIEDGRSVVANGPLAGQTLSNVIANHPELLGNAKLMNGCFPLLIKYLDANDNLSVQVHPTERYVAEHPESHLKSEAWIVLKAKEGSCIYVGLAHGTTESKLRSAIEADSIPDVIRAIPVTKGECYYLPSGTCHALGEGVVVAEVQTPSDTTFRVWDWGRKGRTMHVDQAVECIDFYATPLSFTQNKPLVSGHVQTTLLASTAFFTAERIDAIEDVAIDMSTDVSPRVLMTIEGEANIEHDQSIDASCGQTVLVPANTIITLSLRKGASVLVFDMPTETMIA